MSNAAGEETDKHTHIYRQSPRAMCIHVKRRKEGREARGHSLDGEYNEFEIYPGRTNY